MSLESRVRARCRIVAAAAIALCGALLVPTAGLATNRPGPAANVRSFLHWRGRIHTAELTLIAHDGDTNGGFNFDGYANGAMTVTVPLGAHVVVKFSNAGVIVAHSFVVVPYSNRTDPSNAVLAFKGASSLKPSTGTNPGFSETVSQAGFRGGFVSRILSSGEETLRGYVTTQEVPR